MSEIEKVKVYNEISGLLVDMMMDKPTKQGVIKAMGKKLSKIGFQIFVLAPDNVVSSYLRWRALASANENTEETIKAFSQLMLDMRKDLYPDTKNTVETANDLFF